MKAMSFFYSRPAVDMTVDSKPPYAEIKFITDVGDEDLIMEQKKNYTINIVVTALTQYIYLYSLD